MITAAKLAPLPDNQQGVVRTWYSRKDIAQLQEYNDLITYEAASIATESNKRYKDLMGNMSNTAKAAVEAANGGVVALDKLNKGFNWAALGATALNFAASAVASIILSLVVTAIDKLVRRVEIAKQKTADSIAELEGAENAIESVSKQIDTNYGRLTELRGLRESDEWGDQLETEYQKLRLQTMELEEQLEIEEKRANTARDNSSKDLKDWANKFEGEFITGASWQYLAAWQYNNPQSAENRVLSRSDATGQAIQRIKEYHSLVQSGNELTEDQRDIYQDATGHLVEMAAQYQEWINMADGLPGMNVELNNWRNVLNKIMDALKLDVGVVTGAADPLGYVRNAVNDLQGNHDATSVGVYKKLIGSSYSELLGQNSESSQAFAWVLEKANDAQMSVADFIGYLVELGVVANDVASDNDQVAASLLDVAKAANNSAEKISDAYDALADAVSDYNDKGFITDDTLTALDKNLPGVIDLLFDESGALTEQAAAAMGSTDALVAFIRAQLQTQITAAQLNLDNVVNQLRAVGDEAFRTTTGIAMVKTAMDQVKDAESLLADVEAMVESGAFRSKGGGGGSKSIYSKEYEQITDLTEHYIAMSEARQKRMEEESSEYKAESRQQFLYYQQLAEQTYAEISRLRAKGYTEANEDFRKLLQSYEGYLGSMYSIAKALWEQEKQERIDNIQKQIDAENDRWEAREKQLNHEKDYYEALLDLEERYLDTISDIHTEIRELDKELATAKTYPEGSNLELFTDDEHDRLVKQLRDIEAEATDLYTKYQEKLSSVSADNTYELSHITDEFQRQYEILLKQYEVSKADLAVARARRELENVLNERNVAMLVNGVWTWVADPEAVKSAVEAVYDAEQSSEDALTDLFNTQRTQLLEETISNIELQRATEEAAHDKIVDGLQDMIDEIEEMKFCFSEFIQTLLAGTDGVASAFASAISQLSGLSGGGFVGSGGSLFGNSQYSSLVSNGKYGTHNGLLVLQDGDDVLPLADGEQFYYKDKGGSLNLVTVGSPNPKPFWAKENNDGVLRLDPAYTGDDDEWFYNVVRPYSSGWKKSFSSGGVASFTGPAKLDGTPSNPEVVFNSADAAKLYHLVHTTPNLVEKLIGNVQARFRFVLPSGFKGGNANSWATDNSRKVYWNGDLLLEGKDADSFLTTLERVLPIA